MNKNNKKKTLSPIKNRPINISLMNNLNYQNFFSSKTSRKSNIEMYNDNVFAIFEKYNREKFRLGFTDCCQVVIYEDCYLDYVVSFDEEFKRIEEIKLWEFK